MEAQEILATLQQRGATVRALKDGRVEVSPRRVLDDELREAIRSHKRELVAELRRPQPADTDLASDPILETSAQLGAVLIRSRRFDREIWIALTNDVAAELHAEEAQRPEPRPVLLPEDVARLQSKSPEAIQSALNVFVVFPGAKVLQ